MKSPDFLLDWFRRMPYHQIAELTIWMDAQADLHQAFEKAIEEGIEEPTTVDCPFDTMEWGIAEAWYNPADNGNQGS